MCCIVLAIHFILFYEFEVGVSLPPILKIKNGCCWENFWVGPLIFKVKLKVAEIDRTDVSFAHCIDHYSSKFFQSLLFSLVTDHDLHAFLVEVNIISFVLKKDNRLCGQVLNKSVLLEHISGMLNFIPEFYKRYFLPLIYHALIMQYRSNLMVQNTNQSSFL